MSNKTHVVWTPAFQNYHSAGDESETFCEECETYLEDDFKYCPGCGFELIWYKDHEDEEDEG